MIEKEAAREREREEETSLSLSRLDRADGSALGRPNTLPNMMMAADSSRSPLQKQEVTKTLRAR
jgi:hypothetical protein